MFTGPGLVVYWLYFSWQRHQDRWQSFRLTLKSLLLAGAGFILANLPLLHPNKFLGFIAFAQKLHIDNQTNRGRSMEGLSFWTWFSTSSTNFIWLPWLILITLMGLMAVRHEWRKKSTKPFALIGLVSFWSGFLGIALLTRKLGYSHYLIPAFAAFPLVLIGILRWLDLNVNRRYRWLCLLVLVVFTSTQFNLTKSQWWNRVVLKSLPRYEIAKADLEKIREYIETLPNSSEVRIMDELKSPTPNKIGQVTRYGPSLEENFLKHNPDFILINNSSDWNLPLDVAIPESIKKQEMEKSRFLFHKAQAEGIKLGEKLVQFHKVTLDLKGALLFRVVDVN